jgi:hypothetical protein
MATGDGAGGFDENSSHEVGTPVAFGQFADDVAVGDVNDDGKPDVIAAASVPEVVLNTTPAPGVNTGEADPRAYGATVGAALNPNGTATTYRIEYGTTQAYGHTTPSLPAGGALTGTANQHVSAALAGLAPLTTYHYRIVASDARGTIYGRDKTFRTTIVSPSASGDPRITGAPRAGSALACATGSWTGAASLVVAWLRDGAAIASGDTYTPAASDAGHALQCRVTARNAGGSTITTSAPVVVAGARRASCVVPSLRGRTVARARTALTAAGCRLGKVKRLHSGVKRGRVIRSTPRAHNVRAAGTRVTIVVSCGR